MYEKWISPPYYDYFESRRVDKHRLDCEKAMCAEKPWQVSLRHAQIFWWLKGTQIRIMHKVLHSHIQTAGIRSSEVSGRMESFKDARSFLHVLSNYPDFSFYKTFSLKVMQQWPTSFKPPCFTYLWICPKFTFVIVFYIIFKNILS